MKYLAWLGWLVVLLLALALVSENAEGQDREVLISRNVQYAYSLHERDFAKELYPTWNWDWMQNYAAQMGQNVVVPDIKTRWEAKYYEEELK